MEMKKQVEELEALKEDFIEYKEVSFLVLGRLFKYTCGPVNVKLWGTSLVKPRVNQPAYKM